MWALIDGYIPYVITFEVCSNFYGMTWPYGYGGCIAPQHGLHSTVVVGYQSNGFLISLNSWGSYWGGNNGYFLIHYGMTNSGLVISMWNYKKGEDNFDASALPGNLTTTLEIPSGPAPGV